MALKCKVIGIGAAGNKAAINLMKKNVVEKDKVLLLNSTKIDIPDDYKESAIEFGVTEGCGKERDPAKQAIAQALMENQISLETFIRPEDNLVIIVTSLEGGTGCGASVIVAQYINEILIASNMRKDLSIHMFGFTGFEADPRGLKNTVDWFNDLLPSYTVEVISNKKFLNGTNSISQAEMLANDEFVRRVNILLGRTITPSARNIDNRDLFKLSTTPGFMTIEQIPLTKIKDKDQFNSLLNEMVEKSKSLETEQSCKRMGVILNISSKSEQYIDESFSVLVDHYGAPFELFRHYQDNEEDDFINIIVSGMKMPVDIIKDLFEKYEKGVAKIDTSRDSFFDRKFDTTNGNIFNTSDPFGTDRSPNVGLKENMNQLREKFFNNVGGGFNTEKAKQNFAQSIKISSQL